jgi:hypothetical protein
VIGYVLNSRRAGIASWARNAAAGARYRLNYIGQEVIGRGINKGQSIVTDRTNARIILEATGDGKYHVFTAFVE